MVCVSWRSPAKGGDLVPYCDSRVLEAGMPIHSVALYSYGQAASSNEGTGLC